MNDADTQALGWTLLHFVWQGAAIALLAGAASALLRAARPATRYAVFCGALALMAAAPAVTLFFLSARWTPAAPPVRIDLGTIVDATIGAPGVMPVPPDGPFPWIAVLVVGWLCGLVLLAVRQLGGFVLAMRLAHRGTVPVPEPLLRSAAGLCERLGVRRGVRILQSAIAEVPSAIGWLRPVVLLPVSAVTAMTPQQLELLLAHELAHVKRYDYLVNLLQTAVETVLYYHPAVWWVSAQIRAEREHCCDDLAVAACGDAAGYAATLATLEGLRTRPHFAMAADGGSLLARIRRLTGRRDGQRYAPPAWVGALIPVAVVAVTLLSVPPPPAVAEKTPDEAQAVSAATELPTTNLAPAILAAVASPPAPQAKPAADAKPAPGPQREGFLGGLTAIGYTDISVDEIIELRNNGVAPSYIGALMAAGLGKPSVDEVIEMHNHGVRPELLKKIVDSKLVSDISFETAVRLQDHGAPGSDLLRVPSLGFGPFTANEAIRLRENGVDFETFLALKEAGAKQPTAADAIEFRQNDVTTDRIRSMRDQGFTNLSLQQIVKLRRAGVI